MFNIFSKTQTILLSIITAISVFLFGRNNKLSKENTRLNQEKEDLERNLRLQEKIKHAIKNTKHTTLAGNIKRMRKDNEQS